MASFLKAPEPFVFSGDLAAQWNTWRRQFEWYLKATRKGETDEEVLVGVLLTLLGAEGLKIYDTFSFTDAGDANKIVPVLVKFTEHFEPRRSECYERFKFLRRHQKQDESTETWMLDLKGLVKNCNYGTQVESILRDQLVIGVFDQNTRERLLYEKDLTLVKAVDILRACEASKNQLDHMKASESVPAVVHRIVNNNNPRRNTAGGRSSSSNQQQQGLSHDSKGNEGCPGCGRQHQGPCWAADKTCFGCGEKRHLKNVCPKKSRSVHAVTSDSGGEKQTNHNTRDQPSSESKVIHTISAPAPTGDYLFLHSISSAESKSVEWCDVFRLEGLEIQFKLDTGASCNVLPVEMFSRLPSSRRRLRPGPRLKNYGAGDGWLKALGVQTCRLYHRGKTFVLDFVVVDEKGQPAILGLPSCQELDLVRRVHSVTTEEETQPSVVQEYIDVFRGLGKLSTPYDIKLKPGIDPVVRTARRIPFKLRDPVEKMLKQMEELEVIERVTEPTEWVSQMVVASKPDGSVRLCLDPTDLNKAIQRQHHSIPSAEELFGIISKARYFASLDATSGFFQIPLSEKSSYLCTMATPFGRYRFRRLPFGIRSAPELFQSTMLELFGGLQGLEIYFDDFLVWGETREQLEERLRSFLNRCRQVNLRLNQTKCRFFTQKVPWLGHRIVQGGLKADPAKVKAILTRPEPKNKQELLRLLGMATYLDKFCPDLSTLARPLRDFLKADAEWVWDNQQKAAFERLKKVFSSVPVLRLFDPALPATVSVDASPTGLGAVLLQAGQPVSYTSTTLTDTQKRYVQIEKELLAVQFGLDRFRQYIFGQQVTVETDHKPLVGLVQKPIAECSTRIQRIRMQMQCHDFTLVYKPGRELYLADALSRAPQTQLYTDDKSQESEEQIHAITQSIMPSQDTRNRYAKATIEDKTLVLVMELVLKRWPEHKRSCPAPAKPFWGVRNDLTVANGLLIRKEAVVVPMSLQQEVLRQVHHGHFGEVKSIERAKSSVYWPGYVEQIRNMVASCTECQENRAKNPAQLLYPVQLPDHPFQKVGTDLFEFRSVQYLLVVDYYSKWPCVVPLKSTTSTALIAEMERIFSDFGVPSVMISDNGTQFASLEFSEYCKKKGLNESHQALNTRNQMEWQKEPSRQ